MFTEIIVNVHPYEIRCAVMEDQKLVELFVEKHEQENIVGNIYKGIVKDVLPGMGAAFINIGIERTAFLHYADIVVDFLDMADESSKPPKELEKDSSRITEMLRAGQEIVVQIQKGPIGKKGARLTGQISIPGKFLILFPNKSKIAISRKIASSAEKSRIKNILNTLKHPDVGLIVRTDAEGNSPDDFATEYNGLYKSWKLLEKQIRYAKPPVCIFEENDLANKLIRDIFSSNISRMVVDDKNFRNEVLDKLKTLSPELCGRIELYQEDSPIFDAYGIEKEIEGLFKTRLFLPSGGNIMIEQTEALTAIDINTGSYTGRKNYEETIRQTNLEAAAEIARQIRLRDISGIIAVDFIDMESDHHRQEVLDALRKVLRRDRARNRVYPFGPLGLVEISRKRTRPNLLMSYSEHCPCCNGTGRIRSRDAICLQIYRWLERSAYFLGARAIKIMVHPVVKKYLEEHPDYLKNLSKREWLTASEDVSQDEFRIVDRDSGEDITKLYNA